MERTEAAIGTREEKGKEKTARTSTQRQQDEEDRNEIAKEKERKKKNWKQKAGKRNMQAAATKEEADWNAVTEIQIVNTKRKKKTHAKRKGKREGKQEQKKIQSENETKEDKRGEGGGCSEITVRNECESKEADQPELTDPAT